MNQAQIYFLITHLPIISAMVGFVVLIFGIWQNSFRSLICAYLIFIIASIAATIAFFLGVGADEYIVGAQGFSEKLIRQPQSYALLAFLSLLILGVISMVAYLVSTMYRRFAENISFIVLIISLLSLETILWTGVLVGKINHPETTESPPKKIADLIDDYE